VKIIGLFAGIGGIEVGMHDAGHETVLLCDIDRAAQAVLRDRFPGVALVGDVEQLIGLPTADVVVAGFPCQDLSQAGQTAGITGEKSGVVREVFRLLRTVRAHWLLLENVPFMLQLDRGRAMRDLTGWLEDEGYMWAYRVLDTRAFGLPQRRQRVILLASKSEDPREVLFHGDEGEPDASDEGHLACGFYWTEGVRGLGWAVDAIPTLKGGSGLGIPSPPAIHFPDGFIGTPSVRDAERLQGFPANWTVPAETAGIGRSRWKLVGNAVSVPVAQWVGQRLSDPVVYDPTNDAPITTYRWPTAAWGTSGSAYQADRSPWPVRTPYTHLHVFLEDDVVPLSRRATAGFLARALRPDTRLRFPDGFLDAVARHLEVLDRQADLAA
jgi:DNA (cytosine-5)-methyltransferase 1